MACQDCTASPNVDCRKYIDTHCIVWTGSNLSCIGAVSNERLDSILQKINTKLCDLQTGGQDTNFAKDDLYFSGDRTHSLQGHQLYIKDDSGTGSIFFNVGNLNNYSRHYQSNNYIEYQTYQPGTQSGTLDSAGLQLYANGQAYLVARKNAIATGTFLADSTGARIYSFYSNGTGVNGITVSGDTITLYNTNANGTQTRTLNLILKNLALSSSATDHFMVWDSATQKVGYREVPTIDLSNYYTKTQLQTPGQSIVDWGNIANAPGFITGITANNGITSSTATNVQLGGTLIKDTTIDTTANYNLLITGAITSASVLQVSNTAATGNGINANTTGVGTAVNAQSTTGTGVNAFSTSGLPLLVGTNPTTGNSVVQMVKIQRQTSGTVADGIGSSIDFVHQTSTGQFPIANSLVSKWTDVTTATRTSQFVITGVDNAVIQDLVQIDGTGATTFLGPSSPAYTVRAINTTGVGVNALVTSGFGVDAYATTGIALRAQVNPSSTNSVVPVAYITRATSGVAANGIGGETIFLTETTDGNSYQSNSLVSKWTNATLASRTSRFEITGVNAGATTTLLGLQGNGALQLNQYGAGTFTGTLSKVLGVDNTGNVIEIASSALGIQGITANNGLTANTSTNVQLGGTLLQNTTIDAGVSYKLLVQGNNAANAILSVQNNGMGIYASSSTTYGLQAFSSGGAAILADIQSADAASVLDAMVIRRTSTNAPSTGIGTAISFHTSTTGSTDIESNRLVSKWTDPVTASRTSQYEIYGYNGGVSGRKMALAGDGTLYLDGYTTAKSGGAIIYTLGVDNTGKVITDQPYTVKNGITTEVSGGFRYFKLGGTLTENTSISVQSYNLTLWGSPTVSLLRIQNNGNTSAIDATSVGGIAVSGGTTSGTGVQGSSGSGLGGHFLINPANTSSSLEVLRIQRSVDNSVTAAAGVGGYLSYYIESATGNNRESGRLGVSLTDVTDLAESSKFELHLKNSGIIGRKLMVDKVGVLTLDAYGTGAITGATAYYLGVDATGKVIELPAPTGGGTGDGNNYPSSLAFDTTTGVLTLSRSGLADLTQDLDGRWSLLGHTHTVSEITDFPAQATNNGKFLTTNGTALSWADVPSANIFTNGLTDTSGTITLGGNLTDMATILTLTDDGVTPGSQYFRIHSADGNSFLSFWNNANDVQFSVQSTLGTQSTSLTVQKDVISFSASHGANMSSVSVSPTTVGFSGKITVDSLKTTVTAPATTGVLKMVTVDENGLLSNADMPATAYTNEMAQDAVGAMVSSEFTYDDVTPLLSINTIAQSKITNLVSDLAGKQATLVSGTNIKTLNGVTLLGTGNITTFTPSGLATQYIKGDGTYGTLATVATSGSYTDLSNKPTIYTFTGLATQYTKGDGTYGTLATVATSGSYTDLSNKPTIYTFTGLASQYTKGDGTYGTLATVATSGSYTDLSNKPTIYSFTGTATQYTKGDGTYSTFNTDVDARITDTVVTGKLLTGYVAGTNTTLAATDSILVAFGKIQAQLNNKQAAGSYEAAITAGTAAQYWRGDKTWQTLDKAAVGLSNVVNLDTSTTTNITDIATKRFVTDTQKTNWDTAYNKRITGFALQSGAGTATKTLRITLADATFFDASFDDMTGGAGSYVSPIEVRFRVGDTGAPMVADDTSFTLKDCSNVTLTGKKVTVYRERMRMYPTDDYTYNSSTGVITFVTPVNAGDRIVVEAHPATQWTECEIGTPPTANSAMINSTDHLLINSTDKLIF